MRRLKLTFDNIIRIGLILFFSSIIFFSLVSSSTAYEFSATDWEKTYSQGPYGRTVQETNDGGFIITSFSNNQPLLLKIDSLGNVVFSKTYDIELRNDQYGVYTVGAQQTLDGGYIMVGTAYINQYKNTDIYLVKTDSLGNLVWMQTYGGLGHDYGSSVQQTSDGGYAIVGSTITNPDQFGRGYQKVMLIKTDSLGNLAWEKTYGGLADNYGLSFKQTNDDGYILIGTTDSFGSGPANNMYLVKIDETGNLLWQKTFGSADVGYAVQQTKDGGYVAVGSYGYFIKLDALGNKVWDKKFGGNNFAILHSVRQTVDGGYLIGGTLDYSTDIFCSDVYVIKTDESGEERWSRTFGGKNINDGYAAIQTSDGGYLVCGKKDAQTTMLLDGNGIYVIKLKPEVINNNVTVAFDSQGGNLVESIYNIPIWSTINSPATPTRSRYTFGGWYKEASCINAWDFSKDTVTGNVTLYAKWIVIGPLAIQTSSLPDSIVDSSFYATASASGGTLPYTWSATGLPIGLSINTSTGVISGTPVTAGIYTVNITVYDSNYKSINSTLLLVVNMAAVSGTITSPPVGSIFQQGTGYQTGDYDQSASQPSAFNWTRQSRFNGPQHPLLKWVYLTGNAIQNGVIDSSAVIGTDGTIYVTSGNANLLYAINPDGSRKWGFMYNNGKSPAIGSDGTIYVSAYQGGLIALKPDGSKKWNFGDSMNSCRSEPVIGKNGTIFYVGEDLNSFTGYLYAINPVDGSLLWKTKTGNWLDPTPAIAKDGTIYVASDKLYAVNPDGSIKWISPIGGGTDSSPGIASDGTIYIGSFDYNLYAINPDGSKKWAFPTGNYVKSSPAIATDGTIYFGSLDYNLYAINPDGNKKWVFATKGAVVSSPVISKDGTVYVGSYDGKIYAINPDGSKKWMFHTSFWVSAPPAIGSDGTLYVGTMGGMLLALVDPTMITDFVLNGKTDTSVSFNFSAPKGATSVKIQELTNDGATWIDVNGVSLDASSTTCSVIGLTPSTTYEFKLVVTGGIYQGDSNVVTVMTNSTVTEVLSVSNPSTTGFTVSLNPALPGLTASNITILDKLNNPVNITSATTPDNGITYAISATLNAGQTYTITATDTGYDFGTAQSVVVPAALTASPLVKVDTNPTNTSSAGIIVGFKNIVDSTGNPPANLNLTGYQVEIDFDPQKVNILDVNDLTSLGNLQTNEQVGNIFVSNIGSTGITAIDKLFFISLDLIGTSKDSTNITVKFSSATDQNGNNINVSQPATLDLQRGKIVNDGTTKLSLSDAIAGLQYLAKLRDASQINLINMASILPPENGLTTIKPSVKDIIALMQKLVGLRDDSFRVVTQQ